MKNNLNEKTNTLIYIYKKKMNKNRYDIQQQTTTTELGQAHIECDWVKHVRGRPILPKSGGVVTVRHMNIP